MNPTIITWVWGGFTIGWVRESGSPMCPAGTASNPPPYNGTFIGEEVPMPCEAI